MQTKEASPSTDLVGAEMDSQLLASRHLAEFAIVVAADEPVPQLSPLDHVVIFEPAK